MSNVKAPEGNAIELLKADHKEVKALFGRFEDTEDSNEKYSIMGQAINELKVHVAIEEELFYPAIREEAGLDIMSEAEVEHHVARLLIAELDAWAAEDDEELRNARFKVLVESVRHHIKEEEGQMFPRIEESGIDLDALGAQLSERRTQLKSEGVPPDAEHELISQAGIDESDSGLIPLLEP